MGRYAYERGRRFISVGPTGSFDQTPANTGQATGAGDEVGVHPIPQTVTLDVNVSGGTLTALQVDLESSADGTNWYSEGSLTAITGGILHLLGRAVSYWRANISTYTVNAPIPVVNAGITFGAK